MYFSQKTWTEKCLIYSQMSITLWLHFSILDDYIQSNSFPSFSPLSIHSTLFLSLQSVTSEMEKLEMSLFAFLFAALGYCMYLIQVRLPFHYCRHRLILGEEQRNGGPQWQDHSSKFEEKAETEDEIHQLVNKYRDFCISKGRWHMYMHTTILFKKVEFSSIRSSQKIVVLKMCRDS